MSFKALVATRICQLRFTRPVRPGKIKTLVELRTSACNAQTLYQVRVPKGNLHLAHNTMHRGGEGPEIGRGSSLGMEQPVAGTGHGIALHKGARAYFLQQA